VVLIAPTGAGKSGLFRLATLAWPCLLWVIVVPLKDLEREQKEKLGEGAVYIKISLALATADDTRAWTLRCASSIRPSTRGSATTGAGSSKRVCCAGAAGAASTVLLVALSCSFHSKLRERRTRSFFSSHRRIQHTLPKTCISGGFCALQEGSRDVWVGDCFACSSWPQSRRDWRARRSRWTEGCRAPCAGE